MCTRFTTGFCDRGSVLLFDKCIEVTPRTIKTYARKAGLIILFLFFTLYMYLKIYHSKTRNVINVGCLMSRVQIYNRKFTDFPVQSEIYVVSAPIKTRIQNALLAKPFITIQKNKIYCVQWGHRNLFFYKGVVKRFKTVLL